MLNAFKETIVFFHDPTEIKKGLVKEGVFFRVGGLVKENSFEKNAETISFFVEDGENEIKIIFKGILPSLFREGQGIVAEGKMKGSIFLAERVLAKHDENYLPKEVETSLKKKGLWKGNNNKL